MTDADHECERGWVFVDARYVEQEASKVSTEGGPTPHSAVVAAVRNSVYPCRVCQPDLFRLWVGGHLRPDHDRAACGECGGTRRGGWRPAEPKPVGGEPASPPLPDDRHDPDRFSQRRDLQ